MSTYLIINLCIIAFPLLFSFEKNVSYYKKLLPLTISIFITGIAFLIWDAFAVFIGDWSFNSEYLNGIRIFNLPLEEVLFFITVPYSSVFIYESVKFYIPEKEIHLNKWFITAAIFFCLLLMFLFRGLGYTFIVFFYLTIFFFFQYFIRFRIIESLTYLITIVISFIPFFIVNYILTSLPVVVYNNNENWGIRLLTIPAEDMIYSFTMISFWIMFYKYFTDEKRIKTTEPGRKGEVIIIGAGFAGLSAALLLQSKGYRVTVYEQNGIAGGKAGLINKNGFRFDTGPSLLTMPFVLEDVFKDAGLCLQDYIKLKKLSNICRYFYNDGTTINAFADRGKFAQEISAKTTDSETSVNAFLDYSKRIYDITAELFLFTPFRNLADFLNIKALKVLFRLKHIDPFRTMDEAVSSFFSDSKTRQLFNRYATYNGSNPYKAPATLNIIPHVEYNLGSYTVEGGISQIASELYIAAVENGVIFNFNSRAEGIITSGNRAEGIKVNGSVIKAPFVISNMDYLSTQKYLLNKKIKTNKLQFSTSAVIFYWGVKIKSDNLIVHNILFSEDYKKEFLQLFDEKVIPDDPTVYIYISSKENSTDAPEGFENWFVMVNTPAGYKMNDSGFKELKLKIIEKVRKYTSIDISDKIVFEDTADPGTLEEKTGSMFGSIYGLSSNGRGAAFRRPSVKSKEYRGLYFCGGSTHPGGGIPLALLSGRHCAETIMRDHD